MSPEPLGLAGRGAGAEVGSDGAVGLAAFELVAGVLVEGDLHVRVHQIQDLGGASRERSTKMARKVFFEYGVHKHQARHD